MSKVIKACFVKTREKKDTHQVKKEFVPVSEKEKNHDEFTKETAHTIYQETKAMIEELINEAEKSAKTMITKAEKEAELLVNKSQAEYDSIKKKAYEEGLKTGYEEGIDKAEEEIEVLAQETKALTEKLGNFKGKYLHEKQEEIINLIMLISQKIINTVIEFKPELISNIIKNVLKEVGDAEKLIIKVNPVHLPYLYDQQFTETKTSNISFEGDPEVALGGCVVVTENGFVDAQIEEQLLFLKKALKEEANNVGF